MKSKIDPQVAVALSLLMSTPGLSEVARFVVGSLKKRTIKDVMLSAIRDLREFKMDPAMNVDQVVLGKRFALSNLAVNRFEDLYDGCENEREMDKAIASEISSWQKQISKSLVLAKKKKFPTTNASVLILMQHRDVHF